MKLVRYILVWLLSTGVLLQFVPPVNACGREVLQPLFEMSNSPDPPFREFTQGKIGILKPSFGRKTLTIAYRYLNGGSFTTEEQEALVAALSGDPPEYDDGEAIETWIAARKTVVGEEEPLPEIYQERSYDSYDFFPNCSKNAFEVATETLTDRVSRHGSTNAYVRDWLQAQDVVFRNCSQGGLMPEPARADSPAWLRKDRDYQIAAAFFYSLNFGEARKRFEQIAGDNESDWQQTADYLVGRTLVRQASLEANETAKRTLHETAETYLINLLGRAQKLRNGTKRLLALVKFRLRPEERVRELAQVLAEQSGNVNVGQDMIDYVWLLDKFDEQIHKEERDKKEERKPQPFRYANEEARQRAEEAQRTRDAVDRGELIQVWFAPKKPDGQLDYLSFGTFVFQADAPAAEIYQAVEAKLGRKVTPEEAKALDEGHRLALESRKRSMSPNRPLSRVNDYDGCFYDCGEISLDRRPEFLRSDGLSDWIFTFQSKHPQALPHSLEKWRVTQSPAWLAAALVKVDKSSQAVNRLLAAAEKVQPEEPAFATILYHRVRLNLELGRRDIARKLLDDAITNRFDSFPTSAQNQLLRLRVELALTMSEFLKFSARKPVAFYKYGMIDTISEIVKSEAEFYEDDADEAAQKELERLAVWDERTLFDETVAEVFNWHFSLSALVEASRDPALQDYHRQRFLLAAWTRAVLLKNADAARKIASAIVSQVPEASRVFQTYLESRTTVDREAAATFILLKWPKMSPYISEQIFDLETSEDIDYYFDISWWCPLPQTDYDEKGNEIPKQVPAPAFLTRESLLSARTERAALIALGDAKSILGKRVLEWAKERPDDVRLPEALYIATLANESYKFGCEGWSYDQEAQAAARSLLLEKYGTTDWAAKLREREQPR